MSLKVLVGRLDPRKSIWEVDMENMEERINARRERIRKRIGNPINIQYRIYYIASKLHI
jgi:hypothetical protein